MKCLIISGGEYTKAKLRKYDLIIACDKGYHYAKKLKLKPDIVVGDFDSAKMPRGPFSVIKFDTIKNDTDTGLAVSYALRNGYKDIDIICALGKRIDHTYVNIDLLKYIFNSGGEGRILSDNTVISIKGIGKSKIKNDDNFKILSLISIVSKTKINYIKGSKYDVENIVIREGMTRGISNEFVKKNIDLDIKSGRLLAIMTK